MVEKSLTIKLFLLLNVLLQFASSKVSMQGGGFSRSLIVYDPVSTGLSHRFLQMKDYLSLAVNFNRSLILVGVKNEMKSIPSLCDIVELPPTVKCLKKQQFKCPNKTISESTLESSKKSLVMCEENSSLDIKNDGINIDIPFTVTKERYDTVEYILSLMKTKTKGSSIFTAITTDMTEFSTNLIHGFKELGSNTFTYLIPEYPIKPTEKKKLLNSGIHTFDDIWSGTAVSDVNEISREIMELGLMLNATQLFGLSDCDCADLIEFERMKNGLSFCSSTQLSEKQQQLFKFKVPESRWCPKFGQALLKQKSEGKPLPLRSSRVNGVEVNFKSSFRGTSSTPIADYLVELFQHRKMHLMLFLFFLVCIVLYKFGKYVLILRRNARSA